MNNILFDQLPDNAQLTLAELASSKKKGKRGITRLSESHIRRLEEQGLFPSHRKIEGTRCRFYVAGEIKAWLTRQAEQKEA